MRYVIFCQSIASCWNHGNAHFLRGIARELLRRGHQVIVYEPADGWSRTNLARDHGEAALAEGARVVPDLAIRLYRNETLDVDEAIDGA
ncbi:MAG TPA: glycosyltransferase, partial [Xanthobacteraceae bacterium]